MALIELDVIVYNLCVRYSANIVYLTDIEMVLVRKVCAVPALSPVREIRKQLVKIVGKTANGIPAIENILICTRLASILTI